MAIRDQIPGNDILDTDLLPASKVSIENGFRLAIVTEPRAYVRRRLVLAGKVLAQYQDDVGQRIVLRPIDDVASRWFGSMSSRHIEGIVAAMENDHQRLTALFEDADAVAALRFGASPPPGFRDDGTYTWHGHSRRH